MLKTWLNLLIKSVICIILFLSLTSCSGGGSCQGCSSGSSGAFNFTITAPVEYPARVAETAYLTITNTSTLAATNLTYSVPAPGQPGNNISVPVDVSNASESCPTLAVGASCVFPAFIESGSVPGSFTVFVTGDSTNNLFEKTINKIEKAIGVRASFRQQVTANIGLADCSNNNGNSLCILPANQTIIPNSSGNTTVSISALVESITNVNNISITANGQSVSATPYPSESSYAPGSVITYYVSLPANTTYTANIQATCNSGEVCSNKALVESTTTGAGILTVSPSYAVMSPQFESVIYTLTNIGQGAISNIVFPTSTSDLIITNINCNGSLPAPAANVTNYCSYSISLAQNYKSIGLQPQFNVTYNNGLGTQESTSFSINLLSYAVISLESAILSPVQSIGSGSPQSPYYIESQIPTTLTLTYINSGPGAATNFNVESVILSATGYSIESNNCINTILESASFGNNTTCNVVLKVPVDTVESQNLSLESSSIAVSWSDQTSTYESWEIDWNNNSTLQNAVYISVYESPTVFAVLSSSPTGLPTIESTTINSTFYLYYVRSGGYPGQILTYTPQLPSGMTESGQSSCNLNPINLFSMSTCSITVNTNNTYGAGTVNFGSSSSGVTPSPQSSSIIVYSPGKFTWSPSIGYPVYAESIIVTLNYSEGNESPTVTLSESTGTLIITANPSTVNPKICNFEATNVCSVTIESGSIGAEYQIKGIASNSVVVPDLPVIILPPTAYVSDYVNGLLLYNINNDGSLSYRESAPVPTGVAANDWKPWGNVAIFRQYLYQANNEPIGSTLLPGVFAYSMDKFGTAFYQESVPLPNGVANASSWYPYNLVFNGQVAYIADQFSGGKIWRYSVNESGILTYVESEPYPSNINEVPWGLAINESYLYVAAAKGSRDEPGSVFQYRINVDNSLTYIESVTLPAGLSNWSPMTVAVNNGFAYVGSYTDYINGTHAPQYGAIWKFSIADNGNLLNPESQPLPTGLPYWAPEAIAFYNNKLYLGEDYSYGIYIYFINLANGNLTYFEKIPPLNGSSDIYGFAFN